MLVVPPPPGTVPAAGEIASHPRPAVTCAVNPSELLSELASVIPNCTGAVPCCSVTDDNAFGTVTFSSGEFAALTNSTTPTSVVVVPLVGVIDVIEMFPLHVPWLSAF